MKAVDALVAAWVAGIQLAVEGDTLILRAPHPPPEAVLALLSQNKLNILALLRAAGCSVDDLRAAFDERAGILEFDAGLSREAAEREAAASVQDVATMCARYGILIP